MRYIIKVTSSLSYIPVKYITADQTSYLLSIVRNTSRYGDYRTGITKSCFNSFNRGSFVLSKNFTYLYEEVYDMQKYFTENAMDYSDCYRICSQLNNVIHKRNKKYHYIGTPSTTIWYTHFEVAGLSEGLRLITRIKPVGKIMLTKGVAMNSTKATINHLRSSNQYKKYELKDKRRGN